MGKQIVFLVFMISFTIMGMAAATTLAPTSGEDEGGEHVIGPITGGPAADAAPVGGPVPENAFPNLAPTAGPASNAAMLEVTVVSGAVGIIGSFFF